MTKTPNPEPSRFPRARRLDLRPRVWRLAFAIALSPALLPGADPASNGLLVQEGLNRCNRYLHAWLATAEPTTGLIPRNLTDSSYWNGKDSAADNYPFLVLSAALTEPPLLGEVLLPMLETERRLTARPGWLRLTDDFNLAGTPGLRFPEPDAERIFFNSAEYVKDGLLALTEWLGPSPWSERMIELVADSVTLAAIDTPFGRVPMLGGDRDTAVEVSGDYLQALARLYWMSGRDEKYLRWAVRLADNYLLTAGRHHPTRDFEVLGLRDHSCEIIGGLSEIYATLDHASRLPGGEEWAAKKTAYQPHVHEMLNRILEMGINEDGFFYNRVNPKSGAILNAGISDSWGYIYNAYMTVFLVDGVAAYREAAIRPLAALNARYRKFGWERVSPERPRGSADGFADAIEGALNLYNRLSDDARVASVVDWLDSEIRELWSFQQPDGIIEGWHGDGNFARTTIMYCLWKTQGLTAQPWRSDLRLGAVREAGTLRVSIACDEPWTGTIVFDRPRHAEFLHLPIDWPRINQFPEWFTVDSSRRYRVSAGPKSPTGHYSGAQLAVGLPVSLNAGTTLDLTVSPET